MIASVRNLERIHRQFPFEAIHCNGSRDHWIAIYWKTLYRRKAKIIRSRHAVKKIGKDIFHAWAYNRATDLHIYVSRGMMPLCEPPGALKLKSSRIIRQRRRYGILSAARKGRELARNWELASHGFRRGIERRAGHPQAARPDDSGRGRASQSREDQDLSFWARKRAAGNYVQLAGGNWASGKKLICDGMFEEVRPYLSLFDLGFVLSDSIETFFLRREGNDGDGNSADLRAIQRTSRKMWMKGKKRLCHRAGRCGSVAKMRDGLPHHCGEQKAEFRAHSREKVVREFSKGRSRSRRWPKPIAKFAPDSLPLEACPISWHKYMGFADPLSFR